MTQLKYQRIKDKLADRIAAASPGEKLPSERNLAKEYGCSFLTVRKALDILEEKGMVRRQVGSGTFVSDNLSSTVSSRPSSPALTISDNSCIGVLLHQFGDAYAMKLATALEAYAQLNNLTLIIKMVSSLTDDALDKIGQCQSAGASAMVLPWFPGEDTDHVRQLVEISPLPVSLPDCISGLEPLCFEAPSIFGATAMRRMHTAGNYFMGMGYRDIVLLLPHEPAHSIVQKNLAGYLSFCALNDITARPVMVKNSKDTEALVSLLKSQKNTFAVISYDDSLAMQFMMVAHKFGMSAPQDYAILGCNDTPEASKTAPALSTMPQCFEYAAASLLKHARALACEGSDQSYQPPIMQITVRDSCGGKERYGQSLDGVLDELYRENIGPN